MLRNLKHISGAVFIDLCGTGVFSHLSNSQGALRCHLPVQFHLSDCVFWEV